MICEPDLQQPYHGGDLHWAERRFGPPAEGWIDLSTGINPWPYPMPDISPEAWTRLPDTAALNGLLNCAAERYGASGADSVVAAPGTQALIRLLPRLWPAQPVAVVGPTYGEHGASWRDAGHTVIDSADPSDAAERADVIVVTNPNNPDGRRFDPGLLNRIADRLAARGGFLIVDEAFGDLTPELSLAGMAARPGRLVLRSFGKFYGLAGLRLGFAIAAPSVANRLRAALGAWPVSGAAIAVGTAALSDPAWAIDTRARLASARVAMTHVLERSGCEIIGGTDLFILAAHPRAGTLFERLGHAGIFVRHFPERPDRLRFGLPLHQEAEARLTAALQGA